MRCEALLRCALSCGVEPAFAQGTAAVGDLLCNSGFVEAGREGLESVSGLPSRAGARGPHAVGMASGTGDCCVCLAMHWGRKRERREE